MTTPPAPRPTVGWVFAVVQTLSAFGLVLGLWALLGWELALVIASGVTFAGSIALEILSRRPYQPNPAPTPGGDR